MATWKAATASEIVTPNEPPPGFFAVLADQPTLGAHPGVLDYKYRRFSEGHNLYYWALLLWDRIIVLAAFHDPMCKCEKCMEGLVVVASQDADTHLAS